MISVSIDCDFDCCLSPAIGLGVVGSSVGIV